MGKFLDTHKLAKEPLLYQHITDKVFELCIKNNMPTETTRVSDESDGQQTLSFEEENALRYVGGYAIRNLLGLWMVVCVLPDPLEIIGKWLSQN